MKRYAMLIAAVAAMATTASNVQAQAPGKGGKGQGHAQKLNQAFEAGDANKDGFLDRKEFITALHSLFPHHQKKSTTGQKPAAGAAGTAGKDAGGQQHKHHPFEDADTNKDGKVSKAEFAAFIQHKIQQMRQKASGSASAAKKVR